ncbi:helix-turn-helix transcriptional regulator [Streptomyces sp. NPDC051567]|uniref:helix-turn-helix transcriptional regulator n=1 Tax=Streptomyces sp. NPDC051567 TaxID=3365660 RepID=UPI0037A886B9
MSVGRPPVRRRRLSALLIKFREEAGRTTDDAAERIGCHRTKINRIENARLGISLGELRDLLTFYGVTSDTQIEEMVALAGKGRPPGWVQRVVATRESYSDFISYEETARSIRSLQTILIAGLLQTPDYARAAIGSVQPLLSREQADALVTARLERQALLHRPEPPRFSVIQHEAALRMEVGGRLVMGQQLDHLVRMSESPAIELRVVSNQAGASAALFGPFVLFDFANPAFPDVVCLEHRTGTVFLESPEETEEYTPIFDLLRQVALSPDASRELITSVRKDM